MKVKSRKKNNRHSEYADEIKAAIEYGIDISMLIDNLKRSPTERIKRHQKAFNTVASLRKAKRIW